MFVAFFIVHGGFYLLNVIGDGGVVTAGAGLSAFFYRDVAYKLSGVVVIQEPFDLGTQFRVK